MATPFLRAFFLPSLTPEAQEPREQLLMAASLIVTFPVIILFFAAPKYFIRGMAMSGIKGLARPTRRRRLPGGMHVKVIEIKPDILESPGRDDVFVKITIDEGIYDWGEGTLEMKPDICHVGGIKETLKIGARAEVYNIAVAPHNPNGPVGTAAIVHAAATMPNFLILEDALSATRDACQVGDVFKAVNGRIELPTKPGLGIELDDEYLARHPWTGVKHWKGLRYADGGVADV